MAIWGSKSAADRFAGLYDWSLVHCWRAGHPLNYQDQCEQKVWRKKKGVGVILERTDRGGRRGNKGLDVLS